MDQIIASSTPGTVKYALVPFSNYVNIGKANRNAPWMSVPSDYTEHHPPSCWMTTDWNGCPLKTVTYSCPNDGIPQTCSYTTCKTPGPNHNQCDSGWDQQHSWNGCAGSRIPGPDVAVGALMASAIPGILDVGCPSEMVRLTTDEDKIKHEIQDMVAQGETYIPAGMMWGWRALAPDSPLGDGVAYNSAKKIMILMTDGLNTKSQDQTNHEGGDAAAADAAMALVCNKVRGVGIEVYTIALQVPNGPTKTLLQGCATDLTHYFAAENSQELSDAFNKIAGSVVKLALSK